MRWCPVWLLVGVLAHSDVAAQECTSDAEAVVRALYAQVLERQADRHGRVGVYDIAAEGRGSVRSNVRGLAHSVEHQARFLWPPVVEATFRVTRGAPPPRELVAQASLALAQGETSVRELAAMFAAEEAASRSAEGQIPILYARLLGRQPDGNTVAQYAQVAQRDGILAVARALAHSPEYEQRFGANGVPVVGPEPYAPAIRAIYRHLLGRDADGQGLRLHAETAARLGFGAVIDGLLESEEYLQRFGDTRVPGPRGGGPEYCGNAPTRPVQPIPRTARPRD
jgi:hypothetical protein